MSITAKAVERYNALPYRDWDHTSAVYDDVSDRYFFGEDELLELVQAQTMEEDRRGGRDYKFHSLPFCGYGAYKIQRRPSVQKSTHVQMGHVHSKTATRITARRPTEGDQRNIETLNKAKDEIPSNYTMRITEVY